MYAKELTTESTHNPIAIGVAAPRFGWSPAGSGPQTGYQLVVHTADHDGAPMTEVWDSGIVDSDACTAVRYQGTPLQSLGHYVWHVRLRDARGTLSPWSHPATFRTTLLSADAWRATWIGAPRRETAEPPPDPLLRTEFELGSPVRSARLFVCGLGYAVGHLNGRRIGDTVLDTPVTKYDIRVLFTTHDVGGLLRVGRNALGVALGRGFYAGRDPDRFGWHEEPYCDEPKLLAQLEIEHLDGSTTSIASGVDWQVADGPTTFDAVYAGESYDARREPAGWTAPGCTGGWQPAAAVTAPAGRLEPAAIEPIRATRDVRPVQVTPLDDGHLVDFGEMLAGWVRLRARGAPGARVTMRYGELLDDGRLVLEREHGTPDHPPCGPRFQTDEYVFADDQQAEWEPQFTYKGFRYVYVTGFPIRQATTRSSPAQCTPTWRARPRSPRPTASTRGCTTPCRSRC